MIRGENMAENSERLFCTVCGTEAKTFSFVLYGQPATKKNSSMMVKGRALLLPSKTFSRYESRCHRQLMELAKNQQLPHFSGPVRLTARYYLESAAHWPDLVGLMQATADIISDQYRTENHRRVLRKTWLLSDDRIIKSWDGSEIAGIDRVSPRAEIVISALPWRKDEADPYLRQKWQESLFSAEVL